VAYRADIEIAVRGAQELKRLQNAILSASDAVNSLNSNLSGVANLVPRSFDNLNRTVAQAARSFNAAALGTKEATDAAREYVQATDAANAGLRERVALLAKVQAGQRRTVPGDAGVGQQTPALPPQLIRTYEIGKNWVKFFQDAAGVAVDLQARALNTKASWNDFFATAAQAAVNVKANSLNTQKNWNDFFATAAQAAVNVKANSLNTKASWNTFFAEAAQLAEDLTEGIRRTEGKASAAARNRLAADQDERRKGRTQLTKVLEDQAEAERQLQNSKLDEKAARVQAALDGQQAAAAESANQIQKLTERQAEFTTRTNAAARAAAGQTAEFYRQARIAKEVAKLNAAAPAAQLLLAPAAPGAPAMSGGARRRITGSVERLGGARTDDEAQRALRLAQGVKEQVRPLSQIESLYAGIAGEAAKLSRIKALPDSQMLNASVRGIKQLESAEDSLNRERQQSAASLKEIDRLEEGRLRRARKLQARQQYMDGEPPPVTQPGRTRGGNGRVGGAISSALIGGGFPLLFGQGPAAAAGGALGGVAGGLLGGGFGFALSIVGTALGDIITKAEAFDKSLAALNAGLSTTGSTSITTANDVSKLASSLNVTTDEATELLNTFKQFKDGDTREALAGLFGPVGGAATFEAIAKAGVDEKNALAAIFSLRKEIGNDAALQLALQLKSVGASTTQASLLKIILDRSIEISVAQASQVNFTDRLLSIWEGIVAGVAQALSLATRFIAKMQEGSLIKLPFLDKIIAALGGVKGRTPQEIAGGRGKDLAAQLKAERDTIRKALAEETRVAGTENALGQQLKQDAKSPVDRASALRQIQKEFYADQLKILAINVQQVAILEGEEAALQRQAALNEANARIRGTILSIERETALQEAAKTGTVAEVVRLYEQRRKILQDELDIQNEATRAQAAQIQLDKFVGAQQAVQTAVKPFEDLRFKQEQETQTAKTYSRLLQEGILPAEAERRANFDKLVSAQLRSLDIEIAIQKSIIQQAISYGVTIQKVLELQEALKNMEAARAAVTGEAATGPGAGPTDRERLQTEADRVREGLNTLVDPINMITNAAAGIGDAFATSFKGIVDGSMTAKEGLATFFKSVADMFLDMAAQMIAAWIKMAILNTIVKIFGGAASSGASALPTDASGWANSFKTSLPGLSGDIGRTPIGFAEGGFVTGPTSAVIGEGGESEYVIPASKMQSAMSRYSRGARGEGVIAGSGGGTEGGGGAAAAGPMVVDVRYSVERINDVEYVTASQFQAGMRQAAQQGAAQGEQRTLRRLQQSPGTRKRVGI
jgi:hypothetical protein